MAETVTYDAALHQGAVLKLRESYRVKSSTLQNASAQGIIGD